MAAADHEVGLCANKMNSGVCWMYLGVRKIYTDILSMFEI